MDIKLKDLVLLKEKDGYISIDLKENETDSKRGFNIFDKKALLEGDYYINKYFKDFKKFFSEFKGFKEFKESKKDKTFFFSDYVLESKNLYISIEVNLNRLVISFYRTKESPLFSDDKVKTYHNSLRIKSYMRKFEQFIKEKYKGKVHSIFINKPKNRLEDINLHEVTSSFSHSVYEYDTHSILNKPPLDKNGYVYTSSYSEGKYGEKLENHQIMYFRERHDGRLNKGRIIHNINNMWWVVISKNEVRNIASFEIFNLTPETRDLEINNKKLINDSYRGRWSKRTKKEYMDKIEAINNARGITNKAS